MEVKDRKGVGLFLYAESREGILMVQHAYQVHGYPPGQWSLPGGAPHLGEPLDHAAAREVYEETGLSLPRRYFDKPIHVINHRSSMGLIILHTCALGGNVFNLRTEYDEEIAATRWVPQMKMRELWPSIYRAQRYMICVGAQSNIGERLPFYGVLPEIPPDPPRRFF